MKTKNKAFTLAETLVVMGIIGVIAALTIPNLSQSTGNKEKITQVKKSYAQISEAFDRAQAVYGPLDSWAGSSDAENTTRFAQRIIEFMKISKDCGTTTGNTGCLDPGYGYRVKTADGSALQLWYTGENITTYKVFVVSRKSSVTFYFNNNECHPFGFQYNTTEFVDDMKKGGNRWATARWILDYDNMDYLKVDENWKCPNGKVLNVTANPPVTSCN